MANSFKFKIKHTQIIVINTFSYNTFENQILNSIYFIIVYSTSGNLM